MKLLVGSLVLLIACEGTIGSPTATHPNEPPPPLTEVECETTGLAVGMTPLRRLTRAQWIHGVLDVFRLDSAPEDVLERLTQIADGRQGSFANTTAAPSSIEINLYIDAAERWLEQIPVENITDAAGCEGVDACAETLTRTVGRRFFRRGLTDEEVSRYLELHREVEALEGSAAALRTIVTAILASPAHLYREEPVVGAGELRPLAPLSLASRLSFLFWQSGPDETLLARAESGDLETPESIEAEARRLLADPRASRGLRGFVTQWAGVGRLEEQPPDHPNWSPSLGDAMRTELDLLIDDVLVERAGTYAELMTAEHSFVDDSLAQLYGVTPPAEPFGRVELPSERRGIITTAALLAAHGEAPAEVRRGQFVRDQLLCAPHITFPSNVVPDPAADRLVEQPCAGCHDKMDRIGFGFAQFDRLGAVLDDPVETRRGEVVADSPALEEVAGSFEDATELSERLAASDVGHACFARHATRFASGRVEVGEDECSVRAIEDGFVDSGGSVPELMVAIATSDWFRHRSAADLAAEGGTP